MSARKYGILSVDKLAAVGLVSIQDASFRRQFLHLVRGADREHGPYTADLLDAYITRAMAESGYTFAGVVVRLLELHAKAEGY